MGEHIETTFVDITGWVEKSFYNTGGTRDKLIVEEPKTQDLYFFKTSKKTFKYEFWSEIIASKIGQYLGFDVLDYNISYHPIKGMGCFSKSMINHKTSKLTEGISYLTGKDTSYNPKTDKKKYTIKFIEDSLEFANLKKYYHRIIDIIIFDSIIGNSDRHQENWAFITDYDIELKNIKNVIGHNDTGFLKRKIYQILHLVMEFVKDEKANKTRRSTINLQKGLPNKFSQIYDSGCCLGRELLDNRIEVMLVNGSAINSYIRKGKSEIHWEGKKINHFELINNLRENNNSYIKNKIDELIKVFDITAISEIVNNIDVNLPERFSDENLPQKRKELIIKLLDARFKKLIE